MAFLTRITRKSVHFACICLHREARAGRFSVCSGSLSPRAQHTRSRRLRQHMRDVQLQQTVLRLRPFASDTSGVHVRIVRSDELQHLAAATVFSHSYPARSFSNPEKVGTHAGAWRDSPASPASPRRRRTPGVANFFSALHTSYANLADTEKNYRRSLRSGSEPNDRLVESVILVCRTTPLGACVRVLHAEAVCGGP